MRTRSLDTRPGSTDAAPDVVMGPQPPCYGHGPVVPDSQPDYGPKEQESEIQTHGPDLVEPNPASHDHQPRRQAVLPVPAASPPEPGPQGLKRSEPVLGSMDICLRRGTAAAVCLTPQGPTQPRGTGRGAAGNTKARRGGKNGASSLKPGMRMLDSMMAERQRMSLSSWLRTPAQDHNGSQEEQQQ